MLAEDLEAQCINSTCTEDHSGDFPRYPLAHLDRHGATAKKLHTCPIHTGNKDSRGKPEEGVGIKMSTKPRFLGKKGNSSKEWYGYPPWLSFN